MSLMRTWFVTFVAVVIAVAVLLDLTSVLEAQSGRCRLDGYLYNRNRKIGPGGRISAECPGLFHTAPFGNWGVHSIFGGIKNEDQFKGWYKDDGHHQWNSCTTDPKYQAPNPMYYNRPANIGQWQKGEQTEERVNKVLLDTGENGASCHDLWDGEVYTLENIEMRLFELDPGPGDSLVATLSYEDVKIKLQCDSTWACDGKTDWMSQLSVDPSSSRVSAQVYVELKTAEK